MFFKNIRQNNQGIALVLSVLILVNLLAITLIVTDVILRVGKTSQRVGDSEIAYFAAETGIESAIYQIESNQNAATLGTTDSLSLGTLTDVNGSWQRYVEPVYSIRATCIDDNQHVSFPTDPDLEIDKSCVYAQDKSQNEINKSNPLTVRLRPGKSFELDFNISTPTDLDFYPTAVNINWASAHTGQIIILDESGQSAVDTSSVTGTGRIPSSGQFGDAPTYRLRIMNKSAANMTYVIEPQASNDPLPVGISVTSAGYYQTDQKERIVVAERRNWEIY